MTHDKEKQKREGSIGRSYQAGPVDLGTNCSNPCMSYQRKDQGGDQRGYPHVHHPKWEVLEEVQQWQSLFGSGKRDSLRRCREERIDYTPHRLNEYTKPSSSPYKSPSTLPRTYDRHNLHGKYPTLTTWPTMQS